jgi:YcxB-like protein
MEITFEVKLSDYVIGSWFQTLKNPSARKILLFPFIFPLLPLAMIFLNILTGSYPVEFFWRNLPEILRFTAVYIVVLGVFMFIIQTIAYMMMMPKGKRNGVSCLHTIILDENDLIEITDVNTTFSDWNGFKSISSLPNCVLIQNKGNQSHIIPKRYFEDKQQVEEFVELANFYHQKAAQNSNESEALIYNRQEEVKKILSYRRSLDNSSRFQTLIDEA